MIFRRFLSWVGTLLTGGTLAVFSGAEVPQSGVQLRRIEYHGWGNCIEIANPEVRLIVAPQIGRIMFYGLHNRDNLLWENPGLLGKSLPEDLEAFWKNQPAWNNFGGDKVWPTPQDLFESVNGRTWPPDPWLDGAPHEIEVLSDGVILSSPVSPLCGVRLTRTIRLEPEGTLVSIQQTLQKVKPGRRTDLEPIPLTIWSITQIPNPEEAVFPVSQKTGLPGGIHVFPFEPRAVENVSVKDGFAHFVPSREFPQKIGSDSDGWLAAVAKDLLFVQLFQRVPGEAYPDNSSSIEVFSNPQYTELELLSPIQRLSPGESLSCEIRWAVCPRQDSGPAEDLLETLKVCVEQLNR